ncbi:MAG: SusD/RagB family nutrient-binding outer membrane lipoprotein [Mediterranea sp.]|nr:SusD/RagB family nutrient-binding outer membrane lipoprotein [Mediterranea sp.]
MIDKSILRPLTFIVMAGIAVSCTGNYEDYNVNPYEANKKQMEYDGYMMRSALTTLQAWVIPLDVNACQFTDCLLGGSYGGYLSDSNSGFNNKNFGTYAPQEGWSKVLFNDVIPKIFPALTDLKNATSDSVPLAVGNVIKVMAMQRITDAYGPIPYSKIGEEGSLTAPYDSQEEIYKQMFAELDSAIHVMTRHRTEDFTAQADMVYSGKVEKWVRLANSLKLRLAIRISVVAPDLAREKGEEAVKHEIGPILDNADNAYLTVASSNPFRVVCYEYNGGDSRVSADITSFMNGYKDPRREKFFTPSTFTEAELDGRAENGYHGLRSGIYMPAADMLKHYANINVSTNSPILWMNASEVAFICAEGVMRGWHINMTGEKGNRPDERFYRRGIRLSFEKWGVGGADAYMENRTFRNEPYKDPMGLADYSRTISTAAIQWLDTDWFSMGNLERLITQKWIANFPMGLEAWAEYRRTGYPRLMPASINNSGGTVDPEKMARRLTYPQTEYTENNENLSKAIANHLGGPDTMGTDVWWAKKK